MEVISSRFSRTRKYFSLLTLFIMAGFIFHVLAHKIDYTRVIYKRLKAPDPYTYERVAPAILAIDPSTKINKEVITNPSQIREALVSTFWGKEGFPGHLFPQKVVPLSQPDMLGKLEPHTLVYQMTLEMELGFWSDTFYLTGSPSTDRLVIYHHGFGEPALSMQPLFRALIGSGFDLIVVTPLGHPSSAYAFPEKNSKEKANIFHQMSAFDRPYRYHLNPIFASLNYVLTQKRYKSIDMIGFSMGAYLTAVTAAIEPRIERSYPIAGAYPAYLRTRNEIMSDGPPSYEPMLNVASSLDLFILGATGSKRRQVQIYNRYDRCCFNGLRGKTYEKHVLETVGKIGNGGSFAIILDESHADHRISKKVIQFLLNDLERR